MSWVSMAAEAAASGTAPNPPTAPPNASTPPPASMGSVKMITDGDLFSAPPESILIRSPLPLPSHSQLTSADACNTLGSWNSGVAAAFKALYPWAHRIYVSHCHSATTPLTGTTLLIPPQPADIKQHWIACLFTSTAYGKNVDPPEMILSNTTLAIRDLAGQVERLGCAGVWHAAKINSVRFRVPWESTVAVIENEARREVVVYEYEEPALAASGMSGELAER